MNTHSGPATPPGSAVGGPTGWRSRLIGHSALEPLLFISLALLYIWLVRPTQNDLLKGPMLAGIVLIPFISVFLHRDGLREMGLRLDNLVVSARDVGLITLLGAVIVLGIGLLAGARPRLHAGLIDDFLLYPLWGIVQQFAMQAFTYRRLREGIGGVAASALLTAFLFGVVHYPNLALALVTAVGGYAWCRLFERHPNLFTLALSHGWLAVLLRYSWPAAWLHNLRIGPGYWTWTP
jgi:hypothetical protein